ncbi:hypothetical protein TpMuguga_01g00111 [Theileria parva strain Muguga]|uniref:Uncharacterized protein n=1 Tax=Theileria parva TaxID=5875 RepID=Q4N9K3_THEPA|nr:uncharacterized protein TpMuguga_01g00111 [Theileria parva strain Muguga]EAN33355.1 hypothetical protein TpMuguga_01g00111 [Theileria parva strain Muguga]|eukprot:XP_765638.1 hypothetical protein [Theileria parva strain Muguga]
MTLSGMKQVVETFDVSESTSSSKSWSSENIANKEKELLEDNNLYDVESITSDSSVYEEFDDFDPSNFRLTPQNTISPKREAVNTTNSSSADEAMSSEFKSVDSYESFYVLSLENQNEPSNKITNTNNSVSTNHNVDISYKDKVPVDVDEESMVVDVEDPELDVEMELDNVMTEIDAGNVSFDAAGSSAFVNTTNTYTNTNNDTNNNTDNVCGTMVNTVNHDSVENDVVMESEDELDSLKLQKYLKSQKITEICKRLKADLKGTKYTDEKYACFSERVYNYISDLKSYSSISSQDPTTTTSTLTSVDLKPLSTDSTNSLDDSAYDLVSAREALVFDTQPPNRDQPPSTQPTDNTTNIDNTNNTINNADNAVFRSEFEVEFQDFINKHRHLINQSFDSSADTVDTVDNRKSNQKEIQEVFKNKETTANVEDSDKIDLETESYHGLESVMSSSCINLVFSCLRSIKIAVGDNLHEHNVYTGTKKFMSKFLEILRKLNVLEKKLKNDFLALENNDYNLELTRNGFLTLMKVNNRLLTLYNNYKDHENLQRDSIRLKIDGISLLRSEILSKLEQTQMNTKVSDVKETLLARENRLEDIYNETGFFVLPLNYHNSYQNILYLFNFNYYTKVSKSYQISPPNTATLNNNINTPKNTNALDKTNKSVNNNTLYKDELFPDVTKEMLDKLRVLDHLPFKPVKLVPDLELKLFLWFQNSNTSSSNALNNTVFNNFLSPIAISSSSSTSSNNLNLSPYANSVNHNPATSNLFNNTHSSNNGQQYQKNNSLETVINLDVDENNYIDLFTVRNDLKLVLYCPMHKDVPYYRFKSDLVQYYNHFLNSKMVEFAEDVIENVQLVELLNHVMELTRDINHKFVSNLNMFHSLTQLSTNYYYLSQWSGDSSNSSLSNGTVNQQNSLFVKERVLKLMLTFKNNMPCLWCLVYFNFNTGKSKNPSPNNPKFTNRYFAEKNLLVSGIKFEFVHKLNKSLSAKYQAGLDQINRLISTPGTPKDIIEHITGTLNSQEYYM